jgi:hypothetical protein
MTGGQLFQLLRYHGSCAQAGKKVATDFTWIVPPSGVGYSWIGCTVCGSKKIEKLGPTAALAFVDNWWYKYMQGAASALANLTWDEATRSNLMDEALQGAGDL